MKAKFKKIVSSMLITALISGTCFLSTQGCGALGSVVNAEAKICSEDVLCAGKSNLIVHTVIEVLEYGVKLGLSGLPCLFIKTKNDKEKNFFGDGGDVITFYVRKFADGKICNITAKNNGQSEGGDMKSYPKGEIELDPSQIELE